MARRRWGSWERFPTARPIKVEDGITAKSRRGAIGETWWSQRFVAVLESFGMGARLGRGRRYARSGQVARLDVGPGRVTASVQGSRARPYEVELGVDVLDDDAWDHVVERMAGEALFAARLLAGEMPETIEDAFSGAGLSLFPARTSELHTSCSCPDWANPCKHVAAALYILAERFDEDPWAIFAWRGRARDELMEQMRGLRRGEDAQAAGPAPTTATERAPLGVPGDLQAAAPWFEGPSGALDAAEDAVAQAAGAAARPSLWLPQLLGPVGLSVGGEDLSARILAAYEDER